jgi:transcriptional regulator with XRE-family HTH domain
MTMNLQVERDKLLKKKLQEDKKIGAEMRKLRKSKGVKASWVAGVLQLSKGYISDLENGKRHWRPFLIQAFKKAL